MTTQKKISDFILKTPTGESVAFSSLRGKHIVIGFWASWCKPCLESFYSFKKIYKKYEGDDFAIYGISIDLCKRAWLEALNEYDLPWLQTIDDKDINESRFSINTLPATFLINPEGRVIMKNFTLETNGEFDRKIAAIMDNIKYKNGYNAEVLDTI